MNYLCVDFGTVWIKGAVYSTLTGKIDKIRFVGDENKDFALNGTDEYVCPTAVYIEKNHDIFIGREAVSKRKQNINNYYDQFKPKLSDSEFIPRQEKMKWAEVIATLLDYVYNLACCIREDIDTVIITIPSITSEGDRRWLTMIEACQLAEFKDFELICEPEAAAWYVYKNLVDNKAVKENEKMMIYDFGGGTFDAAVVEAKNGTLRIMGDGNKRFGEPIGGIFIDNMVREHFYQESEQLAGQRHFLNNIDTDLEGRSIINYQDNVSFKKYKTALLYCDKVKQHAVFAKHYITDSNEDYNRKEDSITYHINVDDFENKIDRMVGDSIMCCDKMLLELGLKWSDISKIAMVGGSSRLALAKRKIQKKMNDEQVKVEILDFKNNNDFIHAISLGGAYYRTLRPTTRHRLEFALDNYKLGDYDEAIIQLEKANTSFSKTLLGFIRYSLGEKKEAVELFKETAHTWVHSSLVLSLLYFRGIGVKKNDKIAAEYIEKVKIENEMVVMLKRAISMQATSKEYEIVYSYDLSNGESFKQLFSFCLDAIPSSAEY